MIQDLKPREGKFGYSWMRQMVLLVIVDYKDWTLAAKAVSRESNTWHIEEEPILCKLSNCSIVDFQGSHNYTAAKSVRTNLLSRKEEIFSFDKIDNTFIF